MRDVEPLDVGNFIKQKRQEGFSANTLDMLYRLLRLIFDLAIQLDVIEKSPVRPKLHKPEMERVEKPTLNASQIRDVLKHTGDEQERLFILLLAVTGLRMGEAAALRWMDFDAGQCRLTINHTLYKGKLKAPKTKASRATIRIHPTIAAILESHKARSPFNAPTDFIFCRADGRPCLPWTVRKHLFQAMEKAGIKRVKYRHGFHTFRHSAGTLLYEKSRDLKLVQGALRHGDISTTSDIYVHLSDKVVGEGTEVLADEILANCDLFVTQKSEMVS